MSNDPLTRVVIKAPSITQSRPTAVPALADAYASGALTDQTLTQLDQFNMGLALKNQLVQLPVAQQLDVYNTSLQPAQQEALRAAGYSLPGQAAAAENAEQSEDGWSGGFFSDALHIADNVAGEAVGALGTVASGAGEALSWANNEMKAAYRQSTTYGWSNTGGLQERLTYMTPAPVLGGLFDNWFHNGDNANASEDGATFFDSDRLSKAQEQIGNDTVFFYAKQVAEGKTPETLISEFSGDETQLAGLVALTESEQFNQAVEAINGAHVSPGRDAADMLGIDPGHKGYGTVSGTVDGLYTVLADPLLFAGPVGKGIQASKYGLSSAPNLGKLFAQKNVQRYVGGFADELAKLSDDTLDIATRAESLATVKSQYKSFAPMLDDMRKARVEGVDGVRDYLSSSEGFARLLQGQAAVRMPLMPYRTWAGEQARKLAARANPLTAAEAKAYSPRYDVTTFYDDLAESGVANATDETKAVIESVISSRKSILGRAATFMTRPTQKVPFGTRLYFNDANAHEEVYKLARFVMPKHWANQTSAAFLAANTEGKRRIMRGLIDTMGEVSGATATSAGRVQWNRLLGDAFGEAGAVRNYAPKVGVRVTAERPVGTAMGTVADEASGGTFDVVKAADGSEALVPKNDTAFTIMREPDLLSNGERAAVFAWQNREYVEVPDFKEMYRLMVQLPMMESAARNGVTHAPTQLMGRVITSGPVDKFTQEFWKPGVLLRPALPIRNGMEEVTNFIMRHSGRELVKGYAGTKVLRDMESARSKVLAKAIGDDAIAAVKAGDYTAAFTGWQKFRVNAHAKFFEAARYNGPMVNGNMSEMDDLHLREFFQEGGWRRAVDDFEDSTDMRVGLSGVKSNTSKAPKATIGGKKGRVHPISGSPFENLTTSGEEGATQWATFASSIARSPDGRIVLENLDDKDAALRKLIEWVDSPEGAWMHRSSDMIKKDGVRRWAENVYDATRGTFSARDGAVFDDLVRQGLDDGVIDPTTIIGRISDDLRPEWTSGQKFMLEVEKDNLGAAIHRAVDKGFGWSEEATKRISRFPTFVPQYLRHRATMREFEDELVPRIGKTAARKLAHQNAYEAAMRDVLEYVDNPAIRSQAAIALRNVFPFWRAQEEFFVRWAKTGIFNPYAFRKLQLTYQGFQQVGAIQKGDDGQDVFTYPLIGEASQAVTKALAKIGVTSYVPVPIGASSKIQYLNQGLDPNNILPSFGPGPSFAMGTIRTLWPQTANIERTLLGDLGAGRNPLMNMVPTPLRRLLDSEEQRASSMLSAAAYMEYAGLSPGPDATADELQKYKDRLGEWSWALTFGRAIFGTVAPASPTMEVTPPGTSEQWRKDAMNTVDEEFWALVSASGDYGKAMGAWMKLHPDTLPFTVAKSDTPSGAIVGSDKLVGEFVTDNSTFFDKYPDAAPFWLGGVDKGDFDAETWQMLGAKGIKVPKTFEEFYEDMRVTPAISTYYDAREAHEAWQTQQMAAGATDSVLDAEDAQYKSWRDMYLLQNPLVADYLAAGGVRARDRENTIQQIELALSDESVPKTESTTRIADLLAAYRAHEGWANTQAGTDQATLDAKLAEEQRYKAYMTAASSGDPAAAMVWNLLLRYQG